MPYNGGDTLKIRVIERWYYWFQPEGGFADRNFHSWTKNPELARIWGGGTLMLNNLLGEQKSLVVRAIGGFNQSLGVGVTVPFLNSTYCNAYSILFEHQRNREMGFNSIDNTLQFFRLNDRFVQEQSQVKIEWNRRFKFHQQLAIQLKIQTLGIDSSVWQMNKDLLLNHVSEEDVNIRGMMNQSYLFLRLGGQRDTRNFNHYPTRGSEWKYGLTGFAQWTRGPVQNAFELESRYRKFISLNPKHSLAIAIVGKFRMGETPYLMLRQMGYGMDYVRGFESQVLDGRGLLLGKVAYRYALLQSGHNANLRLLPKAYEKIPIQAWFNIFADVGRVLQPYRIDQNPLSKQVLGSMGVGFDALVYYDALVRTDLSYNPIFKRWVFNLTFYHAL